MIPHEKELVQRLKDEPFVLLGINSDDKSTYVTKRAEMGVTWPSINDASVTPSISTSWGVEGWPTIYVLDHEGVIRFKGVRGEAMDAAVDQLLAEMKGEEKGR
ncbi:MAG: TlpA disulfide reductase family protein [Planctomycetota bacterium]